MTEKREQRSYHKIVFCGFSSNAMRSVQLDSVLLSSPYVCAHKIKSTAVIFSRVMSSSSKRSLHPLLLAIYEVAYSVCALSSLLRWLLFIMLPRSIWLCSDIVIIYIFNPSFIFSLSFLCVCWLVRNLTGKAFTLEVRGKNNLTCWE